MRPAPHLGHFALGLTLAAGLVGVIGVVRLTHQFPAAAASPGLLVPFLRPVLALALEGGALVALSVALFSALAQPLPSGAPPPPTARVGAALLLLAMTLLVLTAAELIPRGTEQPGAFANQLIQSARNSCGASGKVAVPLLGLSVRCAAPQRIEGPMPGAPKVQLAMDQLVFAEDLRSVELSALELSFSSSLRVRLRADRARVRGLAPWAHSPRLTPLARLAVLTALGAALALSALSFVRPRGPQPPPPPSAAASRQARAWRLLTCLPLALPGAAMSAVVITLDQARAAPAMYAVAGVAGAAALALVAKLSPRARQIAASLGFFQ